MAGGEGNRAVERPFELTALPRTCFRDPPLKALSRLGGLLRIVLPVVLWTGRACLPAPVAASARVTSADAEGVVIILEAPNPAWRETSGYVYPRLAGFGLLDESGHPALPVRVERVGIPAGARPRLTILDATSTSLPTGTVGPVQQWIPLVPGSDERMPTGTEDPTVYDFDGFFPAADPVRLGVTGALREHAFVDLVFTPVLHNPVRKISTVFTRVTVRIDFDAVAGAAPAARSAAGDDPGVESLYTRALINAGQARDFRGGGRPPGAEATDLLREGGALAPGNTHYKMIVNTDGIYRLSASWAFTNTPDVVNRSVANLRVDCQGLQIPITVVDANSDGSFNGSDFIEFYGQALTWDILAPDEWNSGDYTDDNVYWLYWNAPPGLRATVTAGAPTDLYPIPADFSETVHHEGTGRFVQQVPAPGTIDHWYESPAVYAQGAASSQTFSVATPGVSTTTSTASIKVKLLGENYLHNDHRSSVKVNNTLVSGPSDWDGFREFTHGVEDGPASFSQSILNDANPDTTNVTIQLPLGRCFGGSCPPKGSGTPILSDIVDENWIEITYGRQFKAGSNDTLVFSVPNQNAQIKLTNLSTNQSTIDEITKTLPGSPLVDPVRITGGRQGGSGPFRVEFEIRHDPSLPPGTVRRFIVSAITSSDQTGDLRPAAVRGRPRSYLRSPSTGVDWLVVYTASLVDTSSPSWMDLTQRRRDQGLRVVTVEVEDVYDEFSYGIEDPQGIRDFFAWVYATWPRIDPNVPLRYAILVGDASYDYKNEYGFPQDRNLLPTYMRNVSSSSTLGYMSDESYFAAVSGADSIPDFFLGRWPVHSIAETNAIADKILAYETAVPGEDWQHDVVFVADDDEQVFEQVQERQITDYLAGTAHTYHRSYEREIPGTTQQRAAEMRDRLIRQFNGNVEPQRDIGPGAAVLSYVGHGSWQDWGSNQSFFHVSSSGTDDLSSLTNGSKLPLLMVADCISGAFSASNTVAGSDLSYSFGEKFLLTPARGAIGVIAPSHLTFINTHDTMEGTFFDEAYGPSKTRGFGSLTLGIQLAFASLNDTVNLRSYTLFGDPAVNLIVPAPSKPANVSAEGGNHQVTVSWTPPGAGASAFNVYQSTNPSGPYSRVGSGVHGTSFVSPNLTNCTAYYYVVTSVDPGGFESAWSHFNTGCGTGGPCVTARPSTPSVPSAPAGVSAADYESGGAVFVTWSPNPASEEAASYTIYWGTSPGLYSDSRPAGAATSFLVGGLTNDVPYYFAVSASNCSQGEGPKTPAPPVIPHRIEGIKPPNDIEDLTVHRSPDPGDGIDDARLDWTPPTTNIYGQPTVVTHQEIYAGQSPTFPVDAAHRIADLPGGSTSSYVHENGFGSGTGYFYLVVAFDANGNRSGVSRELPRGIDGLTLTRSGETLLFTWPAVTHDLDGRSTLVDEYVLYGRVNPFRRSEIAPAMIVRDNLTSTALSIPIPAGTMFFYSVIAVDDKGAQTPW